MNRKDKSMLLALGIAGMGVVAESYILTAMAVFVLVVLYPLGSALDEHGTA